MGQNHNFVTNYICVYMGFCFVSKIVDIINSNFSQIQFIEQESRKCFRYITENRNETDGGDKPQGVDWALTWTED